jgi:hypothetical protein
MITTEMFTNSFYYPAPGFDIQPLKRFTHLCDNFLYANLFINIDINKEHVLNWYKRELNREDFEILDTQVYDDFIEENFFERDNNYRQHLANWPRLYMQANELSDYLQTFEPAHQLPQYLIHFQVKRKSLDKVINLYYFTGEGIASYIVLSQNGKYAPKVLATIQTKMMERPTGIINKFYSDEKNSRPLLWLRGFEPDSYFYGFRGNGNDALENLGVFSVKAIDFRSWSCGRWNLGNGATRRYVKAFITENQNLITYSLSNNYNNQTHTYRIERLNPDNDAYTNNFIVCGAHHLNQLMQMNNQINGVAWEKLLGYNTNCASLQIEKLKNYLEAKNITENLLIFPHCSEDEGKLYHKSILTIRNRTETVLSSPYDFFDLFVTE